MVAITLIADRPAHPSSELIRPTKHNILIAGRFSVNYDYSMYASHLYGHIEKTHTDAIEKRQVATRLGLLSIKANPAPFLRLTYSYSSGQSKSTPFTM